MRVVQLEETPEVRGLEHRGGTFHARTIVEGKAGTPGNFKFSLSRLGTDFKLAKGARFEATGHGVYLLLSGAGSCAGAPLKQYTTVYVEADERATIDASVETVLLHYGLPDLSGIEASGHTSGAMQAAE